MSELFLVTETGPNGNTTIHASSLEEAQEIVRIQREWWKEFVSINKVPERTWTIERYILDEKCNLDAD